MARTVAELVAELLIADDLRPLLLSLTYEELTRLTDVAYTPPVKKGPDTDLIRDRARELLRLASRNDG